MKRILLITIITGIISLLPFCKSYNFRSNYKDINSLMHETENLVSKPFLKAHLKTGEIIILTDKWEIDTQQNVLQGTGTQFDFNRDLKSEGTVRIPVENVAIFETNTKIEKPNSDRITGLALLTGLDVILGIICITNPKACFGSCPTFYLNPDLNFHFSDAEVFSEAIRPSLEYSDIDALNNEPTFGNLFSLTMKNEALETHCVREVILLACPRPEGCRIYHSVKDEFFLCENYYPVTSAASDKGDISELLQNRDRNEWYSLADEKNMSSKEEILLTFQDVGETDDPGLILDFRQSLMTTYLIYSAFGYMGDEVGDIFARMERNSDTKEKVKDGIKKELGKIDIFLWDEKKESWTFQDGFYEIGPIAINRQIIPLENVNKNADLKLKLVLNKGYWRIDHAALTNIKEKVNPLHIPPSGILNSGLPDQKAYEEIIDPKKLLISMPGDEFTFNFILPDPKTDYELFLYAKGYYLEWMRDNWLKNKDLVKLWQMIELPRIYLKEEAMNYKEYEKTMEKEFWDSKINSNPFVSGTILSR